MCRGALVLTLAVLAAAEDDQKYCEGPVTLRYFDVRGRGEAIRMALHDWGIAFEDASFSSAEWGKEQPDGLKAKWTSSGKVAYGQVPLLEIDGLNLVQSHTICASARLNFREAPHPAMPRLAHPLR